MSKYDEFVTANAHTRWIIGPGGHPDVLPPICVSLHRVGAAVLDWLTPDEAAALGAKLTAAALKASPNDDSQDAIDHHRDTRLHVAGVEQDNPADWPTP